MKSGSWNNDSSSTQSSPKCKDLNHTESDDIHPFHDSPCKTGNRPLSVRILVQDGDNYNPDWSRIFTPDNGFNCPEYVKTRYPKDSWFCKSKLTEVERIGLYNQYLFWVESVESNQPLVILYNQAYPVESDQITAELIKAGQSMSDQDIVYYGKYLDRCDKYHYNRTVVISDDETMYKFPIYQTYSPYGLFAYLIFPSGAQQLIRQLTGSSTRSSKCSQECLGSSGLAGIKGYPANPVETAEEIANAAVEEGCLKAVVYHPSIIRLSDPHHEMFGYECREPEIGKDTCTWGNWIWYIIILIFIAIVVAAIIYFLAANISYSPDQRISSGYCEIPDYQLSTCRTISSNLLN